jgi:hypothetical protein
MFLTFSAAFALSSFAVLCSGHESSRLLANSRGIAEPEFRYVAWADLNPADSLVAENGLGYSENTWNNPGSADVEILSFGALSAAQTTAATALGFTEVVWDCFVNHYDDYFWADLATEGVQQYFVALGWTEDSWTEAADPPASEDFVFAELSSEEQTAAKEICFTEALWNEETLVADDSAGWRITSSTALLATALSAGVAGICLV